MIINKRVNTNVYLLQFVAKLKGKVCQLKSEVCQLKSEVCQLKVRCAN